MLSLLILRHDTFCAILVNIITMRISKSLAKRANEKQVELTYQKNIFLLQLPTDKLEHYQCVLYTDLYLGK